MLKTKLNQTLRSIAKTRTNIFIGLSGGETIIESLPFQLDSDIMLKCTFLLIDERIVQWHSINCNRRKLELKDANLRVIGPISEHGNLNVLEHQLFLERVTNTSLNKLVLDVLILGFGNDGHIASIFENIDHERMLYYTTYKKDNSKRMTFSMKLLQKSRNIFLISNSKEKTELLKNLGDELPVHQLIKYNKSDNLWIFEK